MNMEKFQSIIDKVCSILSRPGDLEPFHHILSDLINHVLEKIVLPEKNHLFLKKGTLLFVEPFLQVYQNFLKAHMELPKMEDFIRKSQTIVSCLHESLKKKAVSYEEVNFIHENYSIYNNLMFKLFTSEVYGADAHDLSPVSLKSVIDLMCSFQVYEERINSMLVGRSDIYPGLSQ